MAEIITAEQFQSLVLEGEGAAVVDFYADWCNPCKMLAPVFDEMEKAFSEKCAFYKVNIDNEGALAAERGVMSIPTIIFFKGGVESERVVGLITRGEFEEKLTQL